MEVLVITQKTYPPGMTEPEVAAARSKGYEEAFERCQALIVRFSPEEMRELANRLDDIAPGSECRPMVAEAKTERSKPKDRETEWNRQPALLNCSGLIPSAFTGWLRSD